MIFREYKKNIKWMNIKIKWWDIMIYGIRWKLNKIRFFFKIKFVERYKVIIYKLYFFNLSK